MRLADLPPLPPGGVYRGVVLHWSAGKYLKWFPHYHLCVLGPPADGEVVVTHPILNNLRRITSGMDYAGHTRGRNSGRVGISAMCMYLAGMTDYGTFPPTSRMIETVCALAGLVDAKYAPGQPGGQDAFNQRVRTHYQWARDDGYYPDRWNWMVESELMQRKAWWYAQRAR